MSTRNAWVTSLVVRVTTCRQRWSVSDRHRWLPLLALHEALTMRPLKSPTLRRCVTVRNDTVEVIDYLTVTLADYLRALGDW